MYNIVKQVFEEQGQPIDGFVDDVVERIIEDNGENLTEQEVRQLALQFLEEEET